MKKPGRLRTLYAVTVIAVAGCIAAGCGFKDSAVIASDTRTVFQQKTDAKFSTYNRQYQANENYSANIPSEGVNGQTTTTESAHLTATGTVPIDFFLIDRRTGSYSAFETQVCVDSPQPELICVNTGQDLSAVIDAHYAGM